ncbi:MAG: thiamine pyrophosphate-dependent dehydrogenase E1 component subunit alpha [Acidobacteria bacterium]|nr:thiamine pyrophosphate-dependent dehydrogenase E1 component subunit alpha [Acidobacteriota bacterium]
MAEKLTPDAAVSIYRRMATIRYGEDRIMRGLGAGEFAFSYYPTRGHEAIAASLGEALRTEDYLNITYRGFHNAVAKGTPLREVLAEMMGKATGTSKGKGGPMHLSDPNSGLMVTTGVVGAGAPIAVGLGLAAQLDGDGRVSVCTFGDGATSIGAVHEAMNLAAVWNLPVVFVCENNGWGEHTVQADYTKTQRLSDRAAGYGMVGVTANGTSPVDLFPVMVEAVERARGGGGPTFVEALTARHFGHTFGAPQAYRPAEELAAAQAIDTVAAFRQWLLDNGASDEPTLQVIEKEVAEAIEDAVAFGKESPPAPNSELLVDVFANVSEVPQ